MPFTFSHPAIALPLKALKPEWFSTTGLVVGSIAPDFVYFLKMGGSADFGHTLAGIFILDIPLSFFIALAFHLWARNVLILHFPAPLDKKYSDFLPYDFLSYLKRHWFLFLVSSVAGILSHLFWDDFTKPDGFVYYISPSFFSQKIHIGPVVTPLHMLIERAGSVLGLLFLIWVIWRKKQPSLTFTPFSLRRKVVFWLSLFVSAAIVTAVKLLLDKEGDSISYYVVVLTSAGVLSLAFVTIMAYVLGQLVKKGKA
ncbi:DUF4184 family protein [Pontibacter toksunensis]|uniref:DUF4184 family protein n=1 Tax=Pontibacter toksunensis TaxID=1332631 RepID=A0ABW6BR68_9BACT